MFILQPYLHIRLLQMALESQVKITHLRQTAYFLYIFILVKIQEKHKKLRKTCIFIFTLLLISSNIIAVRSYRKHVTDKESEVLVMIQVTEQNAHKILKDYLKSHGITQAFVAKKMGISPQTFNAYVNGQNIFDADFAFSVAKALNIDPYIFLKESYRKLVD